VGNEIVFDRESSTIELPCRIGINEMNIVLNHDKTQRKPLPFTLLLTPKEVEGERVWVDLDTVNLALETFGIHFEPTRE
jgi:hypothetical protein